MLGRAIDVRARPMRIVSLVPSQTELLADLGLEEEVVGITKFCVHPADWFRTKTRVGGTKTVDIARVRSLQPNLIIANKEENTKADIEALTPFAPVWVSDIGNLAEALQMIRSLGTICGKEERAEAIARQIESGFGALRRAEGIRTAYCIWRNPWMWAGGDTFINDLLARCGLQNVLHQAPRYPSTELSALQELKPELVLLSSEPYPFKDRHIAEVAAALPDAKVLLADGEMFSWYGSRLLHVPDYLARLLQSL